MFLVLTSPSEDVAYRSGLPAHRPEDDDLRRNDLQFKRKPAPATEELLPVDDEQGAAPANRRALLESIKSKRAQRQQNDCPPDFDSPGVLAENRSWGKDPEADPETGEKRTSVQRRLDRIKMSRAEREDDRQRLTCADEEAPLEREGGSVRVRAAQHTEVVSEFLSKPLCHGVQEVQVSQPRPLDEERKGELRGEDPKPTELTRFIDDEVAMDKVMLQKFETSLVGGRSVCGRIQPLEVNIVHPVQLPKQVETHAAACPPKPKDGIMYEIDEEDAKDRAFLEKLMMNPTQMHAATEDFKPTQASDDELDEEEKKDLEVLRKLRADGGSMFSAGTSQPALVPKVDSKVFQCAPSTEKVEDHLLVAAADILEEASVTVAAALPALTPTSATPLATTCSEDNSCNKQEQATMLPSTVLTEIELQKACQPAPPLLPPPFSLLLSSIGCGAAK